MEHIRQYHDHFPGVSQVFVIEEDHFRQPQYLAEMSAHWERNPEALERLDWFGFGSIDHIGKFAQEYGWDAIAETGIGTIFIGVESKFAGEHGYDKRDEIDAREVFQRLHSMGIRTIGAWMCGWDWHDHTNVHEDLNYFVSLYPTYQQLTRVSPFPGTALWERLKDEGRIYDVPWEDVHFWSGAQKNVAFEPHETLNLTEHGYDLLYRTWGPSLLRRLDVQLSGYSFCLQSDNPVLRRHRSRFLKNQSGLLWTVLRSMDRFAPNGVVRRRVRKIDEKYRAIIGEPTPVMDALSRVQEGLATTMHLKELIDPLNMSPKEEPCKRYVYSKNGKSNGGLPYRTEWTPPSLPIQARMTGESMAHRALGMAMKLIRSTRPGGGDQQIDDHLLDRLSHGRLGFGF